MAEKVFWRTPEAISARRPAPCCCSARYRPMIGAGFARGDRLRPLQRAAGHGAGRPGSCCSWLLDALALGASCMISRRAWGAYSLMGKGAQDPSRPLPAISCAPCLSPPRSLATLGSLNSDPLGGAYAAISAPSPRGWVTGLVRRAAPPEGGNGATIP